MKCLRKYLCKKNVGVLAFLCTVYLTMLLVFHYTLDEEKGSFVHSNDVFFREAENPNAIHVLPGGYPDINASSIILAPTQTVMVNFSRHVFREGMKGKQISPEERCVGKPFPDYNNFIEVTRHFYVFSVFWDARPNDFDNAPGDVKLRLIVLAPYSHLYSRTPVFCLFKNQLNQSVHFSSLLNYYEMCENHNRPVGGFILSCKVPPEIVSTVGSAHLCSVRLSPSQNFSDPQAKDFTIISMKPRRERRQLSACVSPIFGDVQVSELTEWIELSYLLGIQHATFYNYNVNPKTAALLEIYAQYDRVDVIPWNITRDMDDTMWYHGQLIALIDCLYRSASTSEYVAFVDIDEFIIPYNVSSLSHLIHQHFTSTAVCLSFGMVHYVAHAIPIDRRFIRLKTATSTFRTSLVDVVRTKVIAKPADIFEVGIHHISKPLYANRTTVRVDSKIALLHHYRQCRHSFLCAQQHEDSTMTLRYAELLVRRVDHVFNIYENITGIHIQRPALVNL